MPVSVTQVRVMRVRVMQRLVTVPVRIRLAHVALMRMLGVWVMHMGRC